MKKFIYPIFILFIVSCNNDNKKTIEELINEGNLEELQERRSSLIIQKGQINNELKVSCIVLTYYIYLIKSTYLP